MNDSRPLLSRVANSAYWLARYIERAENVSRCISVNSYAQLDLPLEPSQQWQPLVDTSGDSTEFAAHYGAATQANVIQFLTYDADNPSTVDSCLRAARENARSIRETISSSMWEQVNSLYLLIESQRTIPKFNWAADICRDVRLGCNLFQGISDATMTRGEAWHFLRLGRKLERADQTSRILDVKYFMLLPSAREVGTPYDDILWSAVLRSVSGFEMYRKKYGRISPKEIVEFLVLDKEFPRSVRFCAGCAGESLRAISGAPAGTYLFESERLLSHLRLELDGVSLASVIEGGLHEYLDALQTEVNAIHMSLQNDFVAKESHAKVASTLFKKHPCRTLSPHVYPKWYPVLDSDRPDGKRAA
jgi:uncharacterized alpha-E superfamily protein